MWRELILQRYVDALFAPGASGADVARVEAALGTALPAELGELLGETDGVVVQDGLSLVWPLDRIESDNLAFRSQPDYRDRYMPFEPLLFFGDAGNGDQFAFVTLHGAVRRADVFAWNHEDDSRSWVAPDLRRYLEWWADGRISLR